MMPMSQVYGMGDTSTCGANPCDWWDDLQVGFGFNPGQTCSNWICCAAPGTPACTSVTTGVLASAAQAAGQSVSQTAADTVTSLFSGLFSNPLGIAVIVLGAYVLVKALGK